MSKFSEFVKEDSSTIKSNNSEPKSEDVSKLIDKYSTYSENELMQEFMNESKKKKDSGDFTDEKISKIKNVLSPYLDDEQKQRLNELINMVK